MNKLDRLILTAIALRLWASVFAPLVRPRVAAASDVFSGKNSRTLASFDISGSTPLANL